MNLSLVDDHASQRLGQSSTTRICGLAPHSAPEGKVLSILGQEDKKMNLCANAYCHNLQHCKHDPASNSPALPVAAANLLLLRSLAETARDYQVGLAKENLLVP